MADAESEGRTVAGPFSGRGMADHLLLYDAILERAGRGISGARPGHNHIGQSQAPGWRDMPNRAYNTYASTAAAQKGPTSFEKVLYYSIISSTFSLQF